MKKCSSTLDIHFEILRSQKSTIRSKYVVFHVRAGSVCPRSDSNQIWPFVQTLTILRDCLFHKSVELKSLVSLSSR